MFSPGVSSGWLVAVASSTYFLVATFSDKNSSGIGVYSVLGKNTNSKSASSVEFAVILEPSLYNKYVSSEVSKEIILLIALEICPSVKVTGTSISSPFAYNLKVPSAVPILWKIFCSSSVNSY